MFGKKWGTFDRRPLFLLSFGIVVLMIFYGSFFKFPSSVLSSDRPTDKTVGKRSRVLYRGLRASLERSDSRVKAFTVLYRLRAS